MLIHRADHITDNNAHQARHGRLDATEITRFLRLGADTEYWDEMLHPGRIVLHRVHPRSGTSAAVPLTVDHGEDVIRLQAHLRGCHEQKVGLGLAVLAPAVQIESAEDHVNHDAGGIQGLLDLSLAVVGDYGGTDMILPDGVCQLPAQGAHGCGIEDDSLI